MEDNEEPADTPVVADDGEGSDSDDSRNEVDRRAMWRRMARKRNVQSKSSSSRISENLDEVSSAERDHHFKLIGKRAKIFEKGGILEPKLQKQRGKSRKPKSLYSMI